MRCLAALPLIALVACGTETVAPSQESAAAELVAYTMVLESAEHGPELCLGGSLDSNPPQCGGVPVTNWSWSEVAGEESSNGTTWGVGYRLIGTYDGERFTLTRPVTTDRSPGGAEEPDLPGTPCPEPDGGWRVLDPDRTTDDTMHDMFAAARKLPGFNAAYVDQSLNPATPDDPDYEQRMNDPMLLIANIRLTEGLDDAERLFREIWGGALCVSRARFTDGELRRIQTELGDLPGLLWSGSGGIHDQVEIGVVYDNGRLQAQLDEQYGEGVVQVTSALEPFDG